MRKAIEGFAGQFRYEPVIEQKKNLKKATSFLLAGMGGSHLASEIIQAWNPLSRIKTWSDYGLPEVEKTCLVILSSYSGNTEETISAYKEAVKRKLNKAVISTGGKLIELAKKDGTPYIKLPATGIQPRSALGFSVRAVLCLMGEEKGLRELRALGKTLNPKNDEDEGRRLAGETKGCVPVVYASRKNSGIAYNWKIKLNETGKIPAFCNVLPELNHNEMTGFDRKPSSKKLSENFFFLLLKDKKDNQKIQKRMEILERLYKERGLKVKQIPLRGRGVFEKIFSSLLLADWIALYTAEGYGLEAEEVPMVEEFKKLMA